MKTLVVALILGLAPALAAACPMHDGHRATQSCAEGATFDAAAGTCVPVVTG